jgi:hypothetical protein
MCCGNHRQQPHTTEPARHGTHAASSDMLRGPRRRQTVVYFEYIGPTGLTAIGGRSGARYRFDRNGAVVAVDPSDRRSLLAVPHLRQVTSPW